MRIFMIVLASLCATSAEAQTTSCRWVGSVWYCDAAPSSDASKLDYGKVIRDGQSLIPDYQESENLRLRNEALRAERNRIRATEQRNQLAAKVAKIASEGRCDDARKAALAGGDIELAKLVVEVCKP